jgi:hypothetical protein
VPAEGQLVNAIGDIGDLVPISTDKATVKIEAMGRRCAKARCNLEGADKPAVLRRAYLVALQTCHAKPSGGLPCHASPYRWLQRAFGVSA